MPLTLDNVKNIVEWLGPEGAEAGLEYGDITAAELRALLVEKGIKPPLKAKRRELITELLHDASKKIHKSLDEMLAMNTDELMRYFETERPGRKEVMLILAELDFHPNSEAQKGLYKYAARQIGETGMFQRVAKRNTPNDLKPAPPAVAHKEFSATDFEIAEEGTGLLLSFKPTKSRLKFSRSGKLSNVRHGTPDDWADYNEEEVIAFASQMVLRSNNRE